MRRAAGLTAAEVWKLKTFIAELPIDSRSSGEIKKQVFRLLLSSDILPVHTLKTDALLDAY